MKIIHCIILHLEMQYVKDHFGIIEQNLLFTIQIYAAVRM